MSRCVFCLCLLALTTPAVRGADDAQEARFPLKAKRILFLGDSITNSGHYVAWIETQLRLQGVKPLPTILNLGLPSETCSGLSEPQHPFPRPDVHERLDRALAKVKPDLVLACYGMNDGIYYPFGEERFKAYQDGVRRLVKKVHDAGAKCILITPPPFDPEPLREKGKLLPKGEKQYAYFAVYEGYDDVLQRYGKWIMEEMADEVEMVIDVHRPLTEALAQQRKGNPKFRYAGDGVHMDAAGHRIMGEAILDAWGVPSTNDPDPKLLALVQRRTNLLHDSWLTHVGHKRPGGKPGLPIDEAQQKADALLPAIDELVEQGQQPKNSKLEGADGDVHHVFYPAMQTDGELQLGANYYLWIPQTEEPIRAVIVHQHGCGVGASRGGQTAANDLHWQALAKKWNCALMGSMYEPKQGVNCRLWCDARKGSNRRFLTALGQLAEAAGRKEIATAPWCLWGHSGGAFWASLMQTEHPERIVAIWLRSGTAFGYWHQGEIDKPEISAAVYQVPVMGNPGQKEEGHERFRRAWDGIVAMRANYLSHGARFFEFAPDPRTGHECGDSRYLAIPYFDFWLQHRLPTDGDIGGRLRPVTDEALAQWHKSLAPLQAEYIKTGAVSDDTPPPAPTRITSHRDGEKVIVTWQAQADLQSGLRQFTILRNDKVIGHVPEQPKGRFGRPLFQTLSYHDTPEAPLPAMRFVDENPVEGAEYRVQSINSVGLKSK